MDIKYQHIRYLEKLECIVNKHIIKKSAREQVEKCTKNLYGYSSIVYGDLTFLCKLRVHTVAEKHNHSLLSRQIPEQDHIC